MPSTVDSILQTFKVPPREFSPVPTWWWSGEKVEGSRLRWQMEQYAAGGVYNLIVLNLAAAGPMHGCDADDPPFFSEAWWDLFLGACAEAQRLGLRLWFYDQIGFSGANFQGRLVSRHPEWGAQALESAEPGAELPPHARVLARGPSRTVYAVDRGFDYFNPVACAALLDTVHGEFELRAGAYLGTVIAGSFQDELPSMPAWSPGFAEAFQARLGYSLLDRLTALWEDDAPDAPQVRLDYHRLRAELAERAFFQPLAAWHARHGLLCGCDQQSPSRAAEPTGSTLQYGDYARTHRWYSAPGSDHDGHAKLHSSLAHLYGRPRVWLEAFHSTGWGGTLEETFDWLLPWLRAGVTLYSPHADYYSTRGGWWEWAAPSTCWRQPYWKHYPLFAATVSRLCWLLARGHHVCDIAVLYPTSTVQAGTTWSGATPSARQANDAWRQLTGSMEWAKFQPGWLDRMRRDYDALDEDSLARAEIRGGKLVLGAESFSTLILPACTRLPDGLADRLADFVDAGGRLIALYAWPEDAVRLRAQASAGRITLVHSEAECAAAVQAQPALVEAPVPTLHRRADGLNLLLLTAAPGMATEVHARPSEWWARRSYTFSPARYAKSMEVLLRGARGEPFLLDPFDGERKAVAWRRTPEGLVVTVPFTSGPAQVLAWPEEGAEVEPAGEKFQPLEKVLLTLSNPWKSELVPTVDNRHGDFTKPAGSGPLPVQTWLFRHGRESAEGEGLHAAWSDPACVPPSAELVQAGFGRQGWKVGPRPLSELDAEEPVEVVYSLSRGLFKDPVHLESLGPKGHVAEDFIHFGTTQPGQGVRFHTGVWMDQPVRTHLALGAGGAKRAWINGQEIVETGGGFWWLTPVDLATGYNTIAWEVAPEIEVNLRASWALVDDPASFARPEWMTAPDAPRAHTRIFFSTTWTLVARSEQVVLQLGCNAPCRLVIDGVEWGRQGGFDPYKIGMRMERYELRDLDAGEHDIAIEVRDIGQPVQVLVDARSDRAESLMSGPGWWVARESDSLREAPLYRPQYKEIGWSHLWRRPHPLPRTTWLETDSAPGVVRDTVPDARPAVGPAPAEWLWWRLPPGATAMHVPAGPSFRVWLNGAELAVAASGRVELPQGGAEVWRDIAARFEAGRGRYGGGLLDGPVTYEVGTGWVTLGDWCERGLESYAGGMRYTQELVLPAGLSADAVLDLGAVRGTAEVSINGEFAGARFLGPYLFPVGRLVRAGVNRVEVTVFNTLAPWLEAHSPTRTIWDGTCVSGLFGPVRLLGPDGAVHERG